MMVLTAIALPSYKAWQEGIVQVATLRDLASTLRSARSHAALQHQAVEVEPINGQWSAGWRTRLAHNGQLLREYRVAQAVTVRGNIHKIRFSALGVPVQENGAFLAGTLHVCNVGQATSQHRVVLARSGRISVQQGTLPAPVCA